MLTTWLKHYFIFITRAKTIEKLTLQNFTFATLQMRRIVKTMCLMIEMCLQSKKTIIKKWIAIGDMCVIHF